MSNSGKKVYMLDYKNIHAETEAEDIIEALYEFIQRGLVKNDDEWEALRCIRRDYGE
jgi:hypothetical protein